MHHLTQVDLSRARGKHKCTPTSPHWSIALSPIWCGAPTANPLARTNPLRSIPLIRPASHVLGWTELEKATFILERDRLAVTALEQRYAAACASLGAANRVRGPMRRQWQGKAFRSINSARAQLRQVRVALVAAELAMLRFAPAVAA